MTVLRLACSVQMTVNDVLEEDLEHAARPLVDEAPERGAEGLDAATTGEATNSCLGSMLSLRTETLK